MKLYVQYVRPHLEFSVQAWSPWTEADKECLEKVQRRAVGMVSGLAAKDYEERLRELGHITLEERRHQLDMQQVHRILVGKDKVKSETWFKMASDIERVTRAAADPLNLRIPAPRLEVRKNFFSQRVPESWTKIPQDLKQATTAKALQRLPEAQANGSFRLMGDKMENRHADAGSMMSGHSLSGPTWAMESHPSSIPSK